MGKLRRNVLLKKKSVSRTIKDSTRWAIKTDLEAIKKHIERETFSGFFPKRHIRENLIKS